MLNTPTRDGEEGFLQVCKVHVPTDVNRGSSVPSHLKITCSDVNDDDTPFHPRFVDPATKLPRETHAANATPGSRSDISWPGHVAMRPGRAPTANRCGAVVELPANADEVPASQLPAALLCDP